MSRSRSVNSFKDDTQNFEALLEKLRDQKQQFLSTKKVEDTKKVDEFRKSIR